MIENKLPTNIPFKIVGLIASIITTLAVFAGAVTWISIGMANNTVKIDSLNTGHKRHEMLITKNAEIIRQHAQLLAILDQHDSTLNVLTNFMVKGGRFTEADGKILHNELQTVKDRLQHYEVLETELEWIKESINRLETNIANRFDSLHKKLNISRTE